MRISVCMGVYNGEKYIKEQLESIRLQTRQPDEVILCDDRSTDTTCQVVDEYLTEHSELTGWSFLHNEKNLGYPENFYHVMDCCTGDIVFLADQDDIWDMHKIERMCEMLDEHEDVKVLACTFGLIDSEAKEIHSMMAPTEGKREATFTKYPFVRCFINVNGLEWCWHTAMHGIREKRRRVLFHMILKSVRRRQKSTVFGNWEKYLHIIEDMNIIQVEKNTGYTNC